VVILKLFFLFSLPTCNDFETTVVYTYRNRLKFVFFPIGRNIFMKVINLHQDEQTIIQMAVDQNRFAQQKIYSSYSSKMLSVCRQYIKDLQLAEDVMITAFMKVFTNLKNFEHKGSFEGWIRRIMINECISYIRVKKQVKFMEDETFFEERYNDIEGKFSMDDIQFLIDGLPDGYRMVFNLYVIEGY
jgi:RNA polymerase sigma-70 factor (ECF subfamily)